MKFTNLIILILLLSSSVFGQNVTISGYVEDIESGERLIGANIFDASELKYGTATNTYGFYSLTVPKGKHKLTATYLGYGFWQQEMNLTKDTLINIQISTDVKIDEIVVTASHNQVESSQMGRIDVPLETIKTLPAIFGEVDIMKTIQLLPGVQGGTEGSSGIYVRGGGPDQNLILLDGVPVYNANHLFGFFSVFNADAISNVSLLKGGFPARYGGRLSSVIDINLKEGNMKKLTGNVSIGVISSKFTIEAPIVKDKTSFMISARRTYIDVLAAPIIKLVALSQDDINISAGYFFYDFNAKINHKLSDKDRLFLSVYGGQDKAYVRTAESHEQDEFNSKMRLGWGNIISALRWNHVFTPKLFGNATLTYSRFNFLTDISENGTSYDDNNEQHFFEFGVRYNSGIDDISAKADFDFIPNNNHKIKFGLNGIYHIFRPGATSIFYRNDDFNLDTLIGESSLYAREYAAYLEDDFRIGNKLKMNFGVRLSAFNVRDTTYFSPEPRLSARFIVLKGWSIKASYAEMKQYLHFLTNNTIGMPTDLWLPATDNVVPQKSYQYSVGTSIALTNKMNLVIEGFYKKMDNLVELKEGQSIFGDLADGGSMGTTWEDKIEQGEGWAYGGEILIKKDNGKLTGWIGYTLAWSERKFEHISFGKVFPYRYDRRHDFSIVTTYKFNKNVNIGVTWVYGSGSPTTLSQMQYLPITDAFNNYEYDRIQYFGKRNNYRLPAYHRLDVGVNWSKDNKLGRRTWSFGVYNAYNHLNPFYVDMERYSTDGDPQLRVYSIFPIMPSISYKLAF